MKPQISPTLAGGRAIRAYRSRVALSPFFRPAPLPSAFPSADPEKATLGPVTRLAQLREWTLVLSSMGIAHAVRDIGDAWVILVSEDDRARAAEAIRLYEAENRNWPPRRQRELLPHARSLVAPLLMLLVVIFFSVTGPVSRSSEWFARGTASSDRILHGELWRTVTALTLHADTLHVLGNALTGSIFLSAVNRRLGDGRGPLVVLLGGALGNLMNAAWHRSGHLSIGASTAVFAAVGVLAATQLALNRREVGRSWLERVAPFVGGLALLGMLGASPHSDLLAHLFGLVAGLLVGIVTSLLMAMGRPRAQADVTSDGMPVGGAMANGISAPAPPSMPTSGSRIVQFASGLLTLGLVVGSWALAFHARF
jgi:rhomboid protease GluP